jgi:hypothetical protein
MSDHCMLPWSEPAPAAECDIDALSEGAITLTGNIDVDLTLESGKSYVLDGPTRVLAGRTLTIEPCVKIVGQGPTSLLAVLPGARIEAVGEPDAPIVFTSKEPRGSRAPGDWGGLIILGNARTNEPSRPAIEGLESVELFGSTTDELNDENSGTLAYVRIEFVGREIGTNNETNGLTLGGVGRGTTIHHVMVSNSIDDCFEWFGGTVNASYLVALNCDDDMFDTDLGYQGTVQFAFGRQYPVTLETDSNGFEMDSSPSNINAEPATSARWSNVTLCGTKDDLSVQRPRLGMMLRRGVKGSITNTIATGFDSAALAVQDLPATAITLTHSLLFKNAQTYDTFHQGGPSWFMDQPGNSTERPLDYCDCWANPPVPFPQTAIEGGTPEGFPDPSASFKGAFREATAESNWMTGKWVDWSEN